MSHKRERVTALPPHLQHFSPGDWPVETVGEAWSVWRWTRRRWFGEHPDEAAGDALDWMDAEYGQARPYGFDWAEQRPLSARWPIYEGKLT